MPVSQSTTCSSHDKSQSSEKQLYESLQNAANMAVREKVFESLARIERYLIKRNPAALCELYGWYSRDTCENLDSNQSAVAGPSRFLPAPPPMPNIADLTSITSSSESCSSSRRRKLNFKQKRMEQHQIDMKKIEYLKIPSGVALRGLLVPTPPDSVFNDNCSVLADDMSMNSFEWLETNVSNAAECSRRAVNRELISKTLSNWVFLYFRVLRRNWESVCVEEKSNAPDVNMYAEDQIHKWTLKLRFKILRLAPMKVALTAFLSRMGLENDPSIVFCRDGFYGLMDVGNVAGDINKTPLAKVSFNSTPKYLGLKNGDSIFVKSCPTTERQNMEEVRPEESEKSKEEDEDGEEGEFEFEDEIEED